MVSSFIYHIFHSYDSFRFFADFINLSASLHPPPLVLKPLVYGYLPSPGFRLWARARTRV